MAGQNLTTEVLKPSTGTATDYAPQDQPDGVATFVLNSVNQTSQGEKNKRNTEQSNAISGSFTYGYIPIGKCYINNGRNVIFLVSLDETTSEIGITDKNSVYTAIVNSKDLGFTLSKQIQCLYRLRLGCEDTIYFTDGNESMRNFNFQRPQDYYTSAYLSFVDNNTPGTFLGTKWDIDKFKLFPSYKIPSFAGLKVETGGSTIPGTYNFSIRYLDNDQNPTNWIYNSQLVSIYSSDTGGSYNDITGSSNILNDTLSGVTATDKSIVLTLSDLDSTYRYYQIAVIAATTGNGQVTNVLVSPVFALTQTEFIFDGNIDGYTPATVTELSVGKTDIETVQHIEQIENRLILNNIAGKVAPYCSFQAAASKIVSNYVIRENEDIDPTQDGNAKDPNTYWDEEGYMGGEVYAMGVVYVFDDGLETPSYHVPGRSPGEYIRQTDGSTQTADDQSVITSWSNDLTPWYTDASSYNALPNSLKLKKWQVYDTAVQYSSGITESFGAMAYWENKDSLYTNFSDCSGQDYWGVDACGVTLLGKPVRHHKFPSRTKEPHIREGSIFIGTTGLYYSVSLNTNQVFPSGGLTLNIAYDLNGVPKSYSVTIMSTDLPIENFLVDQFAGDFNTIAITSISGTLTDTGNSALTTYSVFKDVLSSSTVNGTIIRNLGIQFSNISYPDPRIVGHYFVRGARDSQNRTVLDKGIAGRMRKKTVNSVGYTTFSYFTGDINETTSNDSYLFTPRFLFNKESLTGDYIQFENEFIYSNGFVTSNDIAGVGSIFKKTNTTIETREQAYNGTTSINGGHNYKVNKSVILNAITQNTIFEGVSTPVYNLSWSNRSHVINTSPAIPRVGLPTDGGNNGLRNIPYVSYKIDQNVHPVLSNIIYQRIHNSILTPQDNNIVFGGDTFISYLNPCNSLYRKQQKGMISTILSIVLIAAAIVITISTAGVTAPLIAAAVSSAAVAGIEAAIVVTALVAGVIGVTGQAINAITSAMGSDLGQLADDSEFEAATGSGSTLEGRVVYSNEFLQSIYVESEVNIGLRQTENHICGDFFRYADSLQDYFKNRWMYYDQTNNAYLPKGYCCPEIYHYNLDYSRQNLQSKYFPLSDTYDCCSNCVESHPNRSQYSEQSFQEELTDNYKIFLANNYIDIEAEHGPITGVFKRNNNFFINTSEAIWMLPESQQERVTDELITYIGTGSFFSIPFKKIVDSELGTYGSQHKWATINTPQGVLIVSETEGKIVLFDGKFNEISKEGHERYFKNNLKDFFARQFQSLTNIPFPNINNPSNPHGVGIHSVYDEDYERIIITKRDYLILPAFTSSFRVISTTNGVLPGGLTSGQLVFDLSTNKFIVCGNSTSSYTFTEFTNPAFFINKSWTMSYSLDDRLWVGWHSYIPNFYFYNHKNFYSTIFNSNKIWQHNILGSFLSFYGITYPHIVEVVLRNTYTMSERYSSNTNSPIDTRYWEDVSLQTKAQSYDQSYDQFLEQRYVTFNKMIAYNSRQSTGLQLLIPKDETSDLTFLPTMISQTPGQVLITRKEEDWNMNDFRDYRSDYSSPIFTKDWAAIAPLFFIDKVLDGSVIDFNKDWTQLEVLRDKYMILRLIFDNFTNIQLSTNYILNTSGESMR